LTLTLTLTLIRRVQGAALPKTPSLPVLRIRVPNPAVDLPECAIAVPE